MDNRLGKIVVVDDEPGMTALLKYNLVYEGFLIVTFESAAKVKTADVADSQMVIADAMSQNFTGIDLLRNLKSETATEEVPFMLCTSDESDDVILEAFACGADDVMAKPFSLRELVARVKAIVRRRPMPQAPPPAQHTTLEIKHLDLTLDTDQRHARYKGGDLSLTKTEYSILEFLLSHLNSFYTREKIYAEVWKEDDDAQNIRIVDTNISRLRKKLGQCGKHIVNRYGLGYGFFDRESV